MKITGVTLVDFRWCVNDVSHRVYDGNVMMHEDSDDLPALKSGKPVCRARLTIGDSRGPGSRVSWSGRHGPWACWHAYRDVLMRVFERYPDAVVTSGFHWTVTYRGMEGFQELYPETGRRNIGSQLEPVTMPELCDCPYRIVAPLAPDPDLVAELHRRQPAATFFSAMPDAEREMSDREHGDADHVSAAVIRASEAVAKSAEILSDWDKPADPWVFGPEYDMRDDPQSIDHKHY